MPQQRVCDLAKDQRFEGFLLVRSADQRTGGNGAKYLDMNLADRTGEVNAKVWDGNVPPPAPGSVVKVRGGTLEYNGRLQLRVERIRAMAPGDDVDIAALTPCAPEPPEAMLKELYDAIDGFQSQPIAALTREIVRRFEEKLRYYPAAQRIHHAERSGLLHHTTGMLRTARALLEVYPWLNSDLLYAGVILHDLCKTEEMDSDAMGVVRDYSREGLLLGHLVLGVTRIQEAANDLGIAGEPVLLLQHMMLSHHGEAEFGSPRKPMFPEAEVLHWIDLLDARMNEMQTAVSKLKPGVFSEKIWSLDRRLYHADYDALKENAPEG
ncbi:MAG: HD domain-containing protein [Clostridiales bacterium]|nr:HD domain-containing protein [Clostridiales bacterium]MDO4349714.1 HD domain-containing protein [Eubacteriales bacterium]MDY4007348.1 HD domain-containing protein [Candidatus Limiplasma sp.]